ncbi:MAG: LysR substrate-binding domain-containing protein [Bradyrhizobium sp.]
MVDTSEYKDFSLRSRGSTIALQHPRYVVAAAEYGSFRQAAEALRLEQSTLSRRIRQLEESIGVTVFERSTGGVRATPAGRDFLRLARSILEQMDALFTTARNTGRGEAGRLAVGFYTSLSAGNLRATLVDFRLRFPQVEVGMAERSRTRLVTALRNGALDIVIATGGSPLFDSRVLPLWSERILIALPEGHPLAGRDTIYWTDLRAETVLLSQYDPGQELECLLMAKCESAWGPNADRYDKLFKFLVSEGAYLDADTHGNLLVGYFIKASTVHSTEILGDLGFDFVVLDEEHAPPSI